MALGHWLTPETIPTPTVCRRLVIPDDIDIVTAVNGALDLLMQPSNWQQYGAITPQEISEAMRTMFWQYVETDAACMIGAIIPYATDTTPDGTLYCDGGSYLRTDYPNLYAVLASVYIVDADNFVVPDLRDSVPVGAGSTFAIGDTGGEQTHVLTSGEMPAHTHTEGTATPSVAQTPVVPIPSSVPGIGITGSAGGGAAHNNMQTYVALRYCIIAR